MSRRMSFRENLKGKDFFVTFEWVDLDFERKRVEFESSILDGRLSDRVKNSPRFYHEWNSLFGLAEYLEDSYDSELQDIMGVDLEMRKLKGTRKFAETDRELSAIVIEYKFPTTRENEVYRIGLKYDFEEAK